MHDDNYGFDSDFKPMIIDFMMSNYANLEKKFLEENNTLQSCSATAILSACKSAERLQIAKESISEWNLVERLDQALSQINEEKNDFNRNMLDFVKKTTNLNDYVKKVKSDISNLLNK
jgi:antirestriction protein